MGEGHDYLDVATGSGNAAEAAARRGARVTGLDLVPELIDAARARFESAGLEGEFVVGDAERPPVRRRLLRPRHLDLRGDVRAPAGGGRRPSWSGSRGRGPSSASPPGRQPVSNGQMFKTARRAHAAATGGVRSPGDVGRRGSRPGPVCRRRRRARLRETDGRRSSSSLGRAVALRNRGEPRPGRDREGDARAPGQMGGGAERPRRAAGELQRSRRRLAAQLRASTC